jgi:hypothetical protein
MHAMTDDELAALGWLQRGEGKERKGIVYNTPEGFKVGYETAMAPGRAALIRVLQAAAPLIPEIRDAMARALEPIGSSEMKLTLERRKGRGRPRKDVEDAYEAHKTASHIKEGKALGGNQKLLVADTGASRATTYRRLKMARGVREPEK